MHKKNFIYFAIILFMATLIWFLSNNNKSTISSQNNFGVSDTASISKIFIADRNGITITLNRNKNSWLVNDKYKVRKDAIETLLSTINQIKIKRPVSKNASDNVIKNLATTGVKVEIYTNQAIPIKTYTIGSSTSNHLGTYMYLAGTEFPYVVHIPSFNGFLSPRYGIQGNRISEKDWRSTNIFNLKIQSISKVTINNIKKPEKSFTLMTDTIILFNYFGNSVRFSRNKVFQFLNSFDELNCESYKEDKDKLEFATPLHQLIVNNDTLQTYTINNNFIKEKKDNFNVKRMYATFNNGDLMLIQDYVFNKVLITIDQLQ